MRSFTVKQANQGMRADVFVALQYPDHTRSSLTRLFTNAAVRRQGQIIKAGEKLKTKDKLTVDDSLLKTNPEPLDLPVLYENDNVIVINKPAGVLTHAKGAINNEPTVASFIKDKLTDKRLVGNRAGIVHRLDRGTSGVIIIAKNQETLKKLQKQFSSRRVKKRYRAVVLGVPDQPEAIIDAPIVRNPRRPQTFMVSASGKSAQTIYRLDRIINKDDLQYSLLELEPKTGRTHQLRVHLAYINHPIVGDDVYGKSPRPILLHAQSLEISIPGGKRMVFTADEPSSFKEFIDG